MMKIGNNIFPHGLSLAPMAGYSDRAMRCVCHMQGADYSVSEMVSARAIVYEDEKTNVLARICEDEGPVALQIFGSEPDVMAKATEMITSGRTGGVSPFMIDINMGCPVKKIFSNGEGSALMRSPELICSIVRSVSGATDLPVSVKIRAGISDSTRNAVECALAAEEGGASMITVHGRTREQMYSGRADREIIRNVKDSVHIPVVANGDVTSGEEAVSMLRDTGADGIAVGRGAVGNPFVFREIIAALDGGKYIPPTMEEKIELALTEIRLAVADRGERLAVTEGRKRVAAYFSSFRGASAFRKEIYLAATLSEIESLLSRIDEFL